MKALQYLLIAMAIASVPACKSTKETAERPQKSYDVVMQQKQPISGVSAIPKAVVYKTNGDYNQNVPVNLNAAGDGLASFPAVTDVSAASAPVDLGGGWLLDRRGGIGKHTAFLDYTYAEYAKLPATPSAAELMKHILPGAEVTEAKVLPITYSQAEANPSLCLQYLK